MIVKRHEVDPLDLLRARGGSVAAAQSIAGDLLRRMGPELPLGYEARATWLAYVVDTTSPLGIEALDWDPTDPIPPGSIMLRCSAFSAPVSPESV